MKKVLYVLILLFICPSCVENAIDSEYKEEQGQSKNLQSLLTKSAAMPQEDSITIMSKLQSDVDNLMMGRVIQQDSVFVLAIKREAALFLGVSDDVYDRYLDYVARLNEQLTEE